MDATALTQLLEDVQAGRLSADDAVARLQRLPFTDLGFARVDHHRVLRQGVAETVFGPGKTPDQAAAIVAELLAHDPTSPVLLTRTDDVQAAAALTANPGGTRHGDTVVWRPAPPRPERVVVITAGTGDLPVAEECAVTLTAHGISPVCITDVGVAGIHRLLAVADQLADADAVVVVAGMEGALASVVGGITPAPVIAVPTSVGYGASLAGVTALLGMLASCAAGLTVVGIDNGFGAASAVLRLVNAAAVRAGTKPWALAGLGDDAEGSSPTFDDDGEGSSPTRERPAEPSAVSHRSAAGPAPDVAGQALAVAGAELPDELEHPDAPELANAPEHPDAPELANAPQHPDEPEHANARHHPDEPEHRVGVAVTVSPEPGVGVDG